MSTRLHYGRKFQLWIMSTACVTFHSSWENSLLMALQPMRLQISIKFKPGIMVCLAALQPLLSHCILWISYDTSTPGWKCLFERPLPMKVCVYVRFGHPSFKCKTPHNGYALKIKAVELWHAFDISSFNCDYEPTLSKSFALPATCLSMPLVYSCFSLIWLEVKASCTKKPARCLHFYLCAASNSYGLCLSPFLSFSSLSLCHSSSSPSISLICVFRCAFMRVCCPPLYTCACFLLPAPLRKAKFVESPRIPQSELGFPTNTSTTARNPDLDTYFPGKFLAISPVVFLCCTLCVHKSIWEMGETYEFGSFFSPAAVG